MPALRRTFQIVLTVLVLLGSAATVAHAAGRSRPRLLGARKQFAVLAHASKSTRRAGRTGKGGTTGSGKGKSGTGSGKSGTTLNGTGGSTAPLVPDPSGVPMPTGNLPGWTEDFADDFTEPSLAADPNWTPYNGAPAGNRNQGWWLPSHDVIADGELQLQAYPDPLGTAAGALPGSYVTGGVETSTFSQRYGKFLVRFRIDQGQGIAFDAMLWPITDGTHDEIDFAEDNGAAPRQWNTATVHYGPDNTKLVNALQIDMSQWHTLGVEWSPGQVTYTVDGRDWAQTTNANVPSDLMRIDLQTQSWACGADGWEQCTDSTTPNKVNMEVDWVAAYSGT